MLNMVLAPLPHDKNFQNYSPAFLIITLAYSFISSGLITNWLIKWCTFNLCNSLSCLMISASFLANFLCKDLISASKLADSFSFSLNSNCISLTKDLRDSTSLIESTLDLVILANFALNFCLWSNFFFSKGLATGLKLLDLKK